MYLGMVEMYILLVMVFIEVYTFVKTQTFQMSLFYNI